MDYCLLIDATGSMANLITGAKSYCMEAANDVKSKLLNDPTQFRMSCVCYRDPIDCEDYDNHDFIEFTDNIADVQSFLSTQCAMGGGDIPEDINGALRIALDKFKWRNDSFKMISICTDAPAHGPKFAGKQSRRTEEENKLITTIKEIANKNITLNLIGLDFRTGLQNCFTEIKTIYDSEQPKSICTVKMINLVAQGSDERQARIVSHTMATHLTTTATHSQVKMDSPHLCKVSVDRPMVTFDKYEGRCASPPLPSISVRNPLVSQVSVDMIPLPTIVDREFPPYPDSKKQRLPMKIDVKSDDKPSVDADDKPSVNVDGKPVNVDGKPSVNVDGKVDDKVDNLSSTLSNSDMNTDAKPSVQSILFEKDESPSSISHPIVVNKTEKKEEILKQIEELMKMYHELK